MNLPTNFPTGPTRVPPVFEPDTGAVPTLVPPMPTWIGTALAAALSALVVVFGGGHCVAARADDIAPLTSSIDALAHRLAQSLGTPAMP